MPIFPPLLNSVCENQVFDFFPLSNIASIYSMCHNSGNVTLGKLIMKDGKHNLLIKHCKKSTPTPLRKLMVIDCFIFVVYNLFSIEQNYVSHVKVLLYAQI